MHKPPDPPESEVSSPPRPPRSRGDLVAGRYTLGGVLGGGGMGEVHEAVDNATGRRVALKLLQQSAGWSANLLERFIREARVVAALGHPNIVQFVDTGTDADGTLYIVLELLDGETLASLLRREGTLAPRTAVSMMMQVLEALTATHRAGVVHRDIKPENVFVCAAREGREPTLKVIDFGASKITGGEVETGNPSTTGQLVGTVDYMSPEQLRAEKNIDGRTDVWSVGVMLYRALCGGLPFTGNSTPLVMAAILTTEAVPLHDVALEIPVSLSEIVARALAKNRSERYGTATEMLDELRAWLKSPDARTPERKVAPAPSDTWGTLGIEAQLDAEAAHAQPSAPPSVSSHRVSGVVESKRPVAAPAHGPAEAPVQTPAVALRDAQSQLPAHDAHSPLAGRASDPSPGVVDDVRKAIERRPSMAPARSIRPSYQRPELAGTPSPARLPSRLIPGAILLVMITGAIWKFGGDYRASLRARSMAVTSRDVTRRGEHVVDPGTERGSNGSNDPSLLAAPVVGSDASLTGSTTLPRSGLGCTSDDVCLATGRPGARCFTPALDARYTPNFRACRTAADWRSRHEPSACVFDECRPEDASGADTCGLGYRCAAPDMVPFPQRVCVPATCRADRDCRLHPEGHCVAFGRSPSCAIGGWACSYSNDPCVPSDPRHACPQTNGTASECLPLNGRFACIASE